MAQAELVLDAKAALGEGPSWNSGSGVLYWVDIEGRTLHEYEPSANRTASYPFDKRIGAVVPRASGGVLMAMEDGFYSFDLSSGKLAFLGNPQGRKPGTRFNDGKCDAAGRFWAGTMALNGDKGQGALYCLEKDLTIRTVIEGVTCSNGLAWSPDNRTMYYIDSPTRKVIAYDYDLAEGAIGNPRTVVEIDNGGAVPDGMTSDTDGNLWVAQWGGYGIYKYDPRSGELLMKVEVPAAQSSSCVFGGEKLDTLYITSAGVDIPEEELKQHPHTGGLFRYDAGVRGQPTYSFGG